MIWIIAFYLLTLAASALYICQKYENYKKQNMDKPEIATFTQVPTEFIENERNESKELITSAITNENHLEIY